MTTAQRRAVADIHYSLYYTAILARRATGDPQILNEGR